MAGGFPQPCQCLVWLSWGTCSQVPQPTCFWKLGTLTRKCPASPMSKTLLLGSMYFRTCSIQLNKSYKYNGKIAHTGISVSNGQILEPVALCEKLKKINYNYLFNFFFNSKLGLDRWFRNFPQCIFCFFGHYSDIFGIFLVVRGGPQWAILAQICPLVWLAMGET